MNKVDIVTNTLRMLLDAAQSGRGQIHDMLTRNKCLVFMGHNAATAEALHAVVRPLGKELARRGDAKDVVTTSLVDAVQRQTYVEQSQLHGISVRTTLLEKYNETRSNPPPNSVIIHSVATKEGVAQLIRRYEEVMQDDRAILGIVGDVSDDHAAVLAERLGEGRVLRNRRFNPLNPQPSARSIAKAAETSSIAPEHFVRVPMDDGMSLQERALKARTQRTDNVKAGRMWPDDPRNPDRDYWGDILDMEYYSRKDRTR